MTTKKCPKLTKADTEKPLQTRMMDFLKERGCEVWKITPGNGIPSGASDILFFYEGLYGFLECKAHQDSPYRPGQKQFLAKMDAWSYAKAVYVENEAEIKRELEEMLK